MEIRLLKSSDAESYLRIRLEALQNSPEAYATSYQEEKDQIAEKYKSRFQSKELFTFGAFDKGKLIGAITLVKRKAI